MVATEKTANAADPKKLARRAGLRYVLTDEPGYSRRQNGNGMVYLNTHGRPLRDQRIIARIEKLAIPPAWRDVWICRAPKGHLQATGFDDRDRKQYLYHELWHEAANEDKFHGLVRFGQLLPGLRRDLRKDMRGDDLSRVRVLAGIVALLDSTSIRVGNEEYVRNNNSYGLTTLRSRHVNFERGRVRLRFKGKSGIKRAVCIEDKRLVRLIRQCSRLQGAHLFQWIDDAGEPHDATSADVNAYLQERLKYSFSAKSFRVWKASAHVAGIFWEHRRLESVRERSKVIRRAIENAAELLANTPTICRKYYVHPTLVETYRGGTFSLILRRITPRRRNGLTRDERILAKFLQRECQKKQTHPPRQQC